ncbi:MAG: hypothetical protein JOZ43_08505 [Acidobacteriales bacterium]|nr:hypothetical protein [Terriglobales bacterium]
MSPIEKQSHMEDVMPIEYFEEQAASQRRTLHNSVSRLRTVAKSEIHERLDVKTNLRRFFWPAAGVAALAGLVAGYGFTGMFTDR